LATATTTTTMATVQWGKRYEYIDYLTSLVPKSSEVEIGIQCTQGLTVKVHKPLRLMFQGVEHDVKKRVYIFEFKSDARHTKLTFVARTGRLIRVDIRDTPESQLAHMQGKIQWYEVVDVFDTYTYYCAGQCDSIMFRIGKYETTEYFSVVDDNQESDDENQEVDVDGLNHTTTSSSSPSTTKRANVY
jgi:hypothetical protein